MDLGFRQDRSPGRSLQPHQYPSVSSMPAVRPEPQSLQDMMPQPEGNAQQNNRQNTVPFMDSQNMPANLPAHSIPELHERRASLQAPRAGSTNNERPATERSRQTLRSAPRSAEPTGSLPYPQHDMGSVPSSSAVHGHRPRSSSSVRLPSLEVLREHGISLDEIVSQIGYERRSSVSAPSRPRTMPQPLQRSAAYTQHANISPSRPNFRREDDCNRPLVLISQPESHNHDYAEMPNRGVSKVVVLYFDEEDAG